MQPAMTRRELLRYLAIGSAGTALAACQPRVVEVERVVKETVEVEKVVEKEVIKEVEKEVERIVEPTPVPRQLVEIRVTHSWPAEVWPRQVQFDETFNTEHEWVRVQGENVVWGDYVPKLTAAAAAGAMPDVMYCQFAWAQKFIMDGAVISLQSFLDGDPEFWGEDDFSPESLKVYRWQGELYFIPYDEGATNHIYYNIRLFDEVGYPYPHSDKDWTLDDLLIAATELTRGEGEQRVWGYHGLPGMGGGLNMDFLANWGGRFWSDPCETSSHIHEPEAVEALSWWAKFRTEYRISLTPAEAATIPGNPFGFGRVAMLKGATWDNRWIKPTLKDPYDVAHAPIGPDGKRSAASMSSGYGITKDSKHTEAAWEYLRSYLSTEGLIFMHSAPGIGVTVRRSAYPAFLASPLAPKSAEVFMEALQDYARAEVLDSPNGREITLTAAPIWDRALLQEINIQEACDQITAAVTPVMTLNEEWCKLSGLAGA